MLLSRAYLWILKYRSDSGYWAKASEGLDVCLLRKHPSALGITREGQGAQVLQIQMVFSTGWLEKILAWHYLKYRMEMKDVSTLLNYCMSGEPLIKMHSYL